MEFTLQLGTEYLDKLKAKAGSKKVDRFAKDLLVAEIKGSYVSSKDDDRMAAEINQILMETYVPEEDWELVYATPRLLGRYLPG
jgi:hypothetical protein